MKKITDYTIVYEDEVCKFIKDGWQPYGSPFADDSYIYKNQAMVKYEDEQQPKVDNFEDSYRSLLESVEQLKKGIETKISRILKSRDERLSLERMLSQFQPALGLNNNIEFKTLTDVLREIDFILSLCEINN